MILLRTVVIGGAGAALATAAGLPAAALIGGSVAVALGAWSGLRVAMHRRLRDLGFAGIGISLGAGIGPNVSEDLAAWTTSLVLLCASLAVTLFVATAILRRWFRHDPSTALLASSPGTMSYALAVAQEGRGDIITVLILQSLRLLILASMLPLAVFFLIEPPSHSAPPAAMGPLEIAILLAAALSLGAVLVRTGLPAAYLLAGMALSGLSHVLGLTSGPLPEWALFVCFAITGSVIGARFSGISLKSVAPLLGAAVATTGTAAVVSAGFAAAAALLTELPVGQVWVAFAPGGVEAMAAIGLALGYDPAYVAVHHLVRIVFLVVAIPLLLPRRELSAGADACKVRDNDGGSR